jgi:hypothetical protein
MSDDPLKRAPEKSTPPQEAAAREAMMNPGDEAPPGAPSTGENLCRECRGTGRLAGGRACPNCGGTGRVVQGISAGP